MKHLKYLIDLAEESIGPLWPVVIFLLSTALIIVFFQEEDKSNLTFGGGLNISIQIKPKETPVPKVDENPTSTPLPSTPFPVDVSSTPETKLQSTI